MSRVVFLVEEYSMKVLLDGLLPRLFPSLSFLSIPHDGKHDLEQSIPRKLRAWQEPGVRFVVVRDNDGGDCSQLKTTLTGLCNEGRRAGTLVRIACQELEAWYLGEPEALAEAFGHNRLSGIGKKAKYRDPDAVQHPSTAIEELIPEFQKVSGARRMARHLSISRNSSKSFQVLIEGIERLAANMES